MPRAFRKRKTKLIPENALKNFRAKHSNFRRVKVPD